MTELKSKKDDDYERSTWGNPIEFVLSCLTYAIGLGNVWRFPYLCYRNGGGVFLVTYLIMLIVMGIPIFLVELFIGQYSGMGPEKAFSNISPIFNGLGLSTLLIIALITIYYMIIIAWTVFYFFASFTTELGYGSCQNEFNSLGCYSAFEDAKCSEIETYYNKTCTPVDTICKSFGFVNNSDRFHCTSNDGGVTHIKEIIERHLATEEYFRDYVLGLNGATWYTYGAIRWQLVLCLLLSWIVCYFCVVRGVKTSGKVVYFTAFFPYVILTALVVQGCILDGAIDGIIVYLTPKWEMLLEINVWANAASQVFYSFGIACGSLITLSSYNQFSNNCLIDVMVVAGTNLFTSIYAGFAIFSMLGFLANQMGLPVEDVATDGPGLAFVAYPEAILRLPGSTAWSVCFFFMLFILGIGSQFAGIEAISCVVLDTWPHLRRRQPLVVLVICIFGFLLGLPMCCEGGIYIFTLMEWNTASWAIMLVGLAEVAAVAWAYGSGRMLTNMAEMGMTLSKWSQWFWHACLCGITPVALFGMFCFQMSNFELVIYEGYKFPMWANAIGWLIGIATLVPLFVCAIITVCQRKYIGWDKWRPTPDWKPQQATEQVTKVA